MFNGLPDDSFINITSSVNGHIYELEVSYDGNAQDTAMTGGNDLAIEVIAEVPEPGSAALLALGVLFLHTRRRRV